MKRVTSLIAILGLALLTTSCGNPAESQVNKYFQVMQMLDKDSMASMAINPVEIEFTEYEIISSTEPYDVELLLPKYLKDLKALNEKRQQMMVQASDIEGEIIDLEYEIEGAKRAKKKELEAQMELKKESVKKIEFEFRKVLGKIYEQEQLIEREKVLVKKSASVTDNLEAYEGVIKKAEVFVDVSLASGNQGEYVFILLAYNLKKAGDENYLPNRMVIENIMTKADYDELKQKPAEKAEVKAEEVTEETPKTEEVKAEEK
jgi:hypothetical protein